MVLALTFRAGLFTCVPTTIFSPHYGSLFSADVPILLIVGLMIDQYDLTLRGYITAFIFGVCLTSLDSLNMWLHVDEMISKCPWCPGVLCRMCFKKKKKTHVRMGKAFVCLFCEPKHLFDLKGTDP